MSGVDSGTGGGGQPPSGSCEALVIDTVLSSTKEDALHGLSDGDLLAVELYDTGGQVTVVLTYNGQILGGLTAPLIQRLRECMRQGVTYVARILAINGGHVRVRVSAAP